jgi:hypothetical protein
MMFGRHKILRVSKNQAFVVLLGLETSWWVESKRSTAASSQYLEEIVLVACSDQSGLERSLRQDQNIPGVGFDARELG